MKVSYIYEQVDCLVAITSETFDYHCIKGVASKFTQKKKVPSIRLAKSFCKKLIDEFNDCHLVISERDANGKVKTKTIPL